MTTVLRCISIKITIMQACNKFVIQEVSTTSLQKSVLQHDLEIDYNSHTFLSSHLYPKVWQTSQTLFQSACCFNEGMWYLCLMSPERLPLWKWGDILAPNSSSFSFFDLCRSPSRVDFIITSHFALHDNLLEFPHPLLQG